MQFGFANSGFPGSGPRCLFGKKKYSLTLVCLPPLLPLIAGYHARHNTRPRDRTWKNEAVVEQDDLLDRQRLWFATVRPVD